MYCRVGRDAQLRDIDYRVRKAIWQQEYLIDQLSQCKRFAAACGRDSYRHFPGSEYLGPGPRLADRQGQFINGYRCAVLMLEFQVADGSVIGRQRIQGYAGHHQAILLQDRA